MSVCWVGRGIGKPRNHSLHELVDYEPLFGEKCAEKIVKTICYAKHLKVIDPLKATRLARFSPILVKLIENQETTTLFLSYLEPLKR